MPEPFPSPLQRLALAFYAFFAILFRAEVAGAVHRIRLARRAGEPLEREPSRPALAEVPSVAPPAGSGRGAEAEAVPAPSPAAVHVPPPAPQAAPAAAAAPPAADPRPALQLLAVLQREGRLVDFIEEDLAGFPDATIGAAARTVHAGCKKAIEELFALEPVLREREGAEVTVAPGFDPAEVRLTGNVVGEPPFRGALRHHGWRVRAVKLPPAPDHEAAVVLAPAEVEL